MASTNQYIGDGNHDIFTIFAPKNGDAAPTTGLKINVQGTDNDLNTYYNYLGVNSNLTWDIPTKFIAASGNDLNATFALNFISTSSTVEYATFPVTSGIGIRITGPLSSNSYLIFNYPVKKLYIDIIGGGGAGGNGGDSYTGQAGGGGGAGGYGFATFTSTSPSIWNIRCNIGAGGVSINGTSLIAPTSGGSTRADLYDNVGNRLGDAFEYGGGYGGGTAAALRQNPQNGGPGGCGGGAGSRDGNMDAGVVVPGAAQSQSSTITTTNVITSGYPGAKGAANDGNNGGGGGGGGENEIGDVGGKFGGAGGDGITKAFDVGGYTVTFGGGGGGGGGNGGTAGGAGGWGGGGWGGTNANGGDASSWGSGGGGASNGGTTQLGGAGSPGVIFVVILNTDIKKT